MTPQHLKDCKAIGVTCMKYGKKGHSAKCCQRKGAGAFAECRKVAEPPQRIQRIEELSESSQGEKSTEDDDKILLTIADDENGQFTMTGRVNGNAFKTMVDYGFPVTLFAIDDVKERNETAKHFFIRELPKDEEYLDFNKLKLYLLGYIFCHLEVSKS